MKHHLIHQDFPHICPAAGCTRAFRYQKALNTHLTASSSCSWYRKGKLTELNSFTVVEEDIEGDDHDMDEYDFSRLTEDPEAALQDFQEELFQFIPLRTCE
jgi:hypothetical protein